MRRVRGVGLTRPLILIFPLVLSLCACTDVDHRPEPSARRILLTLRYPNESLPSEVVRASLRIVDEEGHLAGPVQSSIVTADSVLFEDVALLEGVYLFLVELFDADGYKVGHGEAAAEVAADTEIHLTIAVIALPRDFDVDVDIDWTAVGDSCYTILPRLFSGRLPVYRDDDSRTLNRFYPSGWMGERDSIDLDVEFAEGVHSGATCVRVSCRSLPGSTWAGVYWLPVPEVRDDWSNLVFGYDLRGLTRIRWWARGEVGGERVAFVCGGVGGGTVRCDDSLPVRRLEVELTTDWREYEFVLSGLPSAQLMFVVGGFGWVVEAPAGVTFFLDDIEFVQ